VPAFGPRLAGGLIPGALSLPRAFPSAPLASRDTVAPSPLSQEWAVEDSNLSTLARHFRAVVRSKGVCRVWPGQECALFLHVWSSWVLRGWPRRVTLTNPLTRSSASRPRPMLPRRWRVRWAALVGRAESACRGAFLFRAPLPAEARTENAGQPAALSPTRELRQRPKILGWARALAAGRTVLIARMRSDDSGTVCFNVTPREPSEVRMRH
jgi:hypothetical protein